LLERAVSCRDAIVESPPCSESVSNWVNWYNKDRPGIQLELHGGAPAAMIVNAPIHILCIGKDPEELNDEWRERCSGEPGKIRIPVDE
jgi:hypothetical protein